MMTSKKNSSEDITQGIAIRLTQITYNTFVVITMRWHNWVAQSNEAFKSQLFEMLHKKNDNNKKVISESGWVNMKNGLWICCLKKIHAGSKERRKDHRNHHHWIGEGSKRGLSRYLSYGTFFNLERADSSGRLHS